MSDATTRPSALAWPAPQFVPAPSDAPSAFTMTRVDVPATLDPDTGIWLPALVADARLHPDEAALVEAMPPTRRATFVAGRLAMRAAVAVHAPQDATGPILRTERGAPVLPNSVAGSVSHKHDAALALVLPRRALTAGASVHVGVDLEHRPIARDVTRPSIARRILTAPELDALSAFDADPLAQRERVILSFALKEAVYKAIDPTVRRYVRFTEVALEFTADGAVAVSLLLPELLHGDMTVRAQYSIDDRWIVATALATAGLSGSGT
ncbi:4'-phosphopantetheinyl transferase family protein [Gemmatimonas groenlandica]|uniref:Enterobactin synthase component D n=1 Tax=Gemmatimonas groenlandica TaxID=2732249 RepID=A0A6M4IQ62_9BACT|nr:4'-phosphopantetheinyl transferase superfamily protein [Gemmatimonas groenlandica]QJR35566.1 4'-phosphopantetheinyl transferase superfamily protein [Gemmatimonas groenlandica]